MLDIPINSFGIEIGVILTMPCKRSKDAFAKDWLDCSSSFDTGWPCCDFRLAFFSMKKIKPSTSTSNDSNAVFYAIL